MDIRRDQPLCHLGNKSTHISSAIVGIHKGYLMGGEPDL